MKVLFASLLFLLALPSLSQHSLPAYGPAFLQDQVASVFIQMDPDSVDLMFSDVDFAANHEWPATFIYQSSLGTDTVLNVGFRLRGNTSLLGWKKSFKVDFNAFEPGQTFEGLEKLNLNGEKNDASMVRSALGWHIIREMGLGGSRTSHVRLYLNDEYRGLYLNTEHIDDAFVDTYIDNGNGNLYKCLWPGDLTYISDNPDDYKFEVGGRRTYELKTNTAPDDYTDIAQFIGTLNGGTANFACEIREVFNVPDYLKLLALDVLMANWDGYAYNKNNYYLYHNQKTGTFDYLAYDLDNTFGIDWIGVDWENSDPYNWNYESRPLYERLMEEEEFRSWFTYYIGWIQEQWFNEAYVSTFVTDRQALIQNAVAEDVYYMLDYGFEVADFDASDYDAAGGHVGYGVVDWVVERNNALAVFLEPSVPILTLNHLRDGGFDSDSLRFKVSAHSNEGSPVVTLWLEDDLLDVGYPMFDDGNHDDRLAGDGLYGVVLPTQENWESLSYRIQAESESLERWFPCEAVTLNSTSYPWAEQNTVVINELMSNNASAVYDEAGEGNDWCELYNSGSAALYLGNLFLTDDLTVPGKWPLPGLTINPGDWVMFWLDEDLDQGPLHANFKLSADGEELALLSNEGGWHLLDWVVFPALESNQSYGRQTDASPTWVVFTESTPDASNASGTTGLDTSYNSEPCPWPNPASNVLNFGQSTSGLVVNSRGQVVLHFQHETYLDVKEWSAGLYLIQTPKGSFRILKS